MPTAAVSKVKCHTAQAIALAVAALLVWLFYTNLQPPVLPPGARMPALAFNSPAGPDTLRSQPGKTTLVMLFSMRCPHCLYELDLFEKNRERLAAIRIYLVTTDRDFTPGVDNLRWPLLARAENILWVHLDEKQYQRHFGAAISPSFYIFDQDGLLREKIRGEIRLDALLERLEPANASGGRASISENRQDVP